MDGQLLPSKNSALCQGRTSLWWSASRVFHHSHLSVRSTLSAPFPIQLELTSACFIQRLACPEEVSPTETEVLRAAARQAHQGNPGVHKSQCRCSLSSEKMRRKGCQSLAHKTDVLFAAKSKGSKTTKIENPGNQSSGLK